MSSVWGHPLLHELKLLEDLTVADLIHVAAKGDKWKRVDGDLREAAGRSGLKFDSLRKLGRRLRGSSSLFRLSQASPPHSIFSSSSLDRAPPHRSSEEKTGVPPEEGLCRSSDVPIKPFILFLQASLSSIHGFPTETSNTARTDVKHAYANSVLFWKSNTARINVKRKPESWEEPDWSNWTECGLTITTPSPTMTADKKSPRPVFSDAVLCIF